MRAEKLARELASLLALDLARDFFKVYRIATQQPGNYVRSCVEMLGALLRGRFDEAKMLNVRAVLGRCGNAGALKADKFPLDSSQLFLRWLLLGGRRKLEFKAEGGWRVAWDCELARDAARRGDDEMFDFLLDDDDVAESVGIEEPLGPDHPTVIAANYGYAKILAVFAEKRRDVLCRGFADSDKTLLHEVFSREGVGRPDGSRPVLSSVNGLSK